MACRSGAAGERCLRSQTIVGGRKHRSHFMKAAMITLARIAPIQAPVTPRNRGPHHAGGWAYRPSRGNQRSSAATGRIDVNPNRPI